VKDKDFAYGEHAMKQELQLTFVDLKTQRIGEAVFKQCIACECDRSADRISY